MHDLRQLRLKGEKSTEDRYSTPVQKHQDQIRIENRVKKHEGGYRWEKCWSTCYGRQRQTGTEDRELTDYIHKLGGDSETQV